MRRLDVRPDLPGQEASVGGSSQAHEQQEQPDRASSRVRERVRAHASVDSSEHLRGSSVSSATSLTDEVYTFLTDDRLFQLTNETTVHLAEIYKDTRVLLGSEHPKTLQALGEVARVHLVLHDFATAERIFRSILSTRLHAFPPTDPDTLSTREELVLALEGQGSFREAVAELRHVARARNSTLGPNHPATLEARSRLACFLDRAGEHSSATQLHRDILAARQSSLGLTHPDTLTSASNLATALCMQGDVDAAIDLQTKTMTARARELGIGHPDTLISMANMAHIVMSQGRAYDAVELFQTVIDMTKKSITTMTPGHVVNLIELHSGLARALHLAGRFQQATDTFVEVWTSRKRLYGEKHPHVRAAWRDLVIAEYEQAAFTSRADLRRQAAAVAKTLATFKSEADLFVMARVFYFAGEYTNATRWAFAALELQQASLPEKHFKIAASEILLALIALCEAASATVAAQTVVLKNAVAVTSLLASRELTVRPLLFKVYVPLEAILSGVVAKAASFSAMQDLCDQLREFLEA